VKRIRVRQHVNPDAPFYEEMEVAPLALDGRQLELEIGCAEAQFLFERARLDAGRRYIGLEIREKLVDFVNRRARVEALPVEAVFCHANLHLTDLFAAGSVDRIYLNFPDPWFKRKHHVRRMIDAELAEGVAALLRPGGDLLVQSDVWDIVLDAMGVFDAMESTFENRTAPWSFWRGPNPFGVRSWRESHCEAEGLPVWRLLYRRSSSPAG
jgi:tRNA (guanine-N7-)-methyltransferase